MAVKTSYRKTIGRAKKAVKKTEYYFTMLEQDLPSCGFDSLERALAESQASVEEAGADAETEVVVKIVAYVRPNSAYNTPLGSLPAETEKV